jgi:DNA-binding transcriptional regulator YhcF (GntR family)
LKRRWRSGGIDGAPPRQKSSMSFVLLKKIPRCEFLQRRTGEKNRTRMDDTKPRAKSKRAAFCWQEKHVLRMIREMFEATGNVGSALLVYQALTEIASDMQSDIFLTTFTHIAQRAGISTRTVNRVIPTFEKLGIISVQRNKINGVKAPSTYTVIRDATPCHMDVTRCVAQSRISEESQEQSLEEHSSKEEHSFSNKKESTRLSLTRQTPRPSFLLSKRERKEEIIIIT